LAPGGAIIVEVPDSAKFLQAHDYSFLWEEHVCYFVEETFRAMAVRAGFEVAVLVRYPGQLEDALVAVLRARTEVEQDAEDSRTVALAPDLFSLYRDDFVKTRDRLHARLARQFGSSSRGVALFGVGHQAIMFANVFGITPFIAAAVDDDPNKRGHFPPGFSVPITSSAELLEQPDLSICLLAVSPRAEHKVRDKLAPLSARGVQISSIFAGVENSILSE
jgi:C-methyltransferase C-terminal domain